MDGFKALLIDMRVNLCGRNIRMTEHFLNNAQVGAIPQEMRRKTVPEKMGLNGLLKPGVPRMFFHDLPDARSCLHFLGRYRTVSLPSLLGEFRQRFNPQLIRRVPSKRRAILQKVFSFTHGDEQPFRNRLHLQLEVIPSSAQDKGARRPPKLLYYQCRQ